MTLSEEARERLADVVELQPTKNAELQDRWGMESGSEVHQYLEGELGDYYFRDDNSLIRATSEAADLVDVEPGIETGPDEEGPPSRIRVPELQSRIVAVLAAPDEESESVVSVLHKLRDEFDVDPDTEDVRSGLQSLRRKDVVEVEYRTVPTFRLTVSRDDLEVGVSD
ncbi:hypothetical protein EA462_05735 [Natrarchaeobius halalkaliphilus]|uniref:Uncharacterized protein n=1 Tax=Natrarchaeobius halalkaliphilus TaxID=1679091 RepID=A0A3N6P2B9_9EURY|nr:DUF5797 family protein [Natrarchaeobius halalkaliphilus]RQG91719.1 hypothetical protein EA462_05735 [Natrarchaeobius halalkaliphilus]